MKRAFLGRNEKISTGADMSIIFMDLAKKDEQAGNILYHQKLYNQSAYFYIQSMEKYIKSFICKKIDITNRFYANELNHNIKHSLDLSIDFMIQLFANNDEILKQQMEKQIQEEIFKGIKFNWIYNAIRYPFYKNNNIYTMLYLSEKDCRLLKDMYILLKKYMNDLLLKL